MSRVKSIQSSRIRKITGGKDPSKLVDAFFQRRGIDGSKYLQQKASDFITWSVPLSPEEELEISLEGLRASVETTVYMGVNIMPVPLRQIQEFLAAVLTVADTLIGAKLSLVNYDVVLSVTEYLDPSKDERLDYFYELITRQKDVIYDAILDEIEAQK